MYSAAAWPMSSWQLKAGAWGVLLEPPDLQRFFDHPHSAVAINGHRAGWDARYGKDTTWLDFLKGGIERVGTKINLYRPIS